MKKILFMTMLVIFISSLVACEENYNEKKEREFRENMYVDDSLTDINGNKVTLSEILFQGTAPSENIDDREDIENYNEKYGYSATYKISGEDYSSNPSSTLSITIFKNDGKIIFFHYLRYNDKISKNTDCDVFVRENKMTSECGDKEGVVYNKILNAINHMAYFDY